MEWTETHDILLLREVMVSDVFKFKKGSVARGEQWEEIMKKLNQVGDPSFSLKEKRSVRDRWTLLRKKCKARIHDEEAASGISPDELSERDQLVEELIEKEESTKKADEDEKKQKEKEKEQAEDVRKRAMERYSQTKERRKSTTEGEEVEKKTKRRRTSEPLVDYLREKSKTERELREKELNLKQSEQEQSQRVLKSILEQQQQMNTAMLSVIEKCIDSKK